LFEFLPEVLVEPGVQKRVVACGTHRYGMDHEETQIIVPPGANRNVYVVQKINDIQRKPRNAEDGYHGNKHAIRSAFPLSVQFFFSGILGTRFGPRAVV
jgi:hypothetical protein